MDDGQLPQKRPFLSDNKNSGKNSKSRTKKSSKTQRSDSHHGTIYSNVSAAVDHRVDLAVVASAQASSNSSFTGHQISNNLIGQQMNLGTQIVFDQNPSSNDSDTRTMSDLMNQYALPQSLLERLISGEGVEGRTLYMPSYSNYNPPFDPNVPPTRFVRRGQRLSLIHI